MVDLNQTISIMTWKLNNEPNTYIKRQIYRSNCKSQEFFFNNRHGLVESKSNTLPVTFHSIQAYTIGQEVTFEWWSLFTHLITKRIKCSVFSSKIHLFLCSEILFFISILPIGNISLILIGSSPMKAMSSLTD